MNELPKTERQEEMEKVGLDIFIMAAVFTGVFFWIGGTTLFPCFLAGVGVGAFITVNLLPIYAAFPCRGYTFWQRSGMTFVEAPAMWYWSWVAERTLVVMQAQMHRNLNLGPCEVVSSDGITKSVCDPIQCRWTVTLSEVNALNVARFHDWLVKLENVKAEIGILPRKDERSIALCIAEIVGRHSAAYLGSLKFEVECGFLVASVARDANGRLKNDFEFVRFAAF